MSTLFVFAEIAPRPEHFTKAQSAIRAIVERTRAEPGCLSFELFDNKIEGKLFLFEAWRSQSDLDAHYETPYTADVFASYETWLDSAPVIRKMTRAA